MYKFVFFCFFFPIPSSPFSLTPNATLYSSRRCSGELLNFTRGSYEPSLAAYGIDNQAYSALIIGPWLFYELENFNEGIAPMDFRFEPYGACVRFQILAGHISSLRSVGDIDNFSVPSITLYATRDFQGEQEYVQYSTGNLYSFGYQRSLIITGEEGWTIYDQPFFKGNDLCFIPELSDVYAPALVPNFATFDPPLPMGSIASIRRGCYGKTRKIYIRNRY